MKCIGLVQPRLVACVAALCVAPMVVISSVARAQSLGELAGVVTDSAGTAIFGAIVEVTGSGARVRTNDKGEFRIPNVATGMTNIQVRRLGFAAMTQAAQVGTTHTQPLHLVLQPVATNVQPVLVQASRVEYTGRLAGYYERLHRRSNGSFISREQIDRSSNKTLSQLISSTPGVNATRLRTGGGSVRIRGMRCRPLVWLDGVPLPAGEVDLDAFPVSTLHGIEIYLGATNSPPGYTALNGLSSCGTILLWSRGRDTEYAEPARQRSIDVEELTAAHAVYTSDQVDTPAHLAQNSLEVIYPPDLVASKTSGSAIAEFVVSTSGEIERGSIGIVTASHPLFAEAAIKALSGARYTAAVKGGTPVRQLVQQPFSFTLGSDSASAAMRR